MKVRPIRLPVAPKLTSPLNPFEFPSFKDEDMLYGQLNTQGDFQHSAVRYLSFDVCTFKKTNFSQSIFRNFEVQDTLFDHCDFSNCELFGGAFHRVIFKNCKLTGANFAESLLTNCLFIDCLLDFSGFSFCQFKIVRFETCSLKEADLFELKWQHLTLTACDLDKSNWSNTSLSYLNFADSRFERLQFSQDLIRNLTVNQSQAISIALALGIQLDG